MEVAYLNFKMKMFPRFLWRNLALAASSVYLLYALVLIKDPLWQSQTSILPRVQVGCRRYS